MAGMCLYKGESFLVHAHKIDSAERIRETMAFVLSFPGKGFDEADVCFIDSCFKDELQQYPSLRRNLHYSLGKLNKNRI